MSSYALDDLEPGELAARSCDHDDSAAFSDVTCFVFPPGGL